MKANGSNYVCINCWEYYVFSDLYSTRHKLCNQDVRKYQSNLGMEHWKAIKKVMRYLQGTKDHMLTYRRSNHLKVIGYSDSYFVGCVVMRKFTLGYVKQNNKNTIPLCFLMKHTTKFCCVVFRSHKEIIIPLWFSKQKINR